MAIQAIVTVALVYTGNGTSAMSQAAGGAQSLELTLPVQTMPGGDSVTSGNLTTLGTSIGTAAQTAMTAAAVVAQALGWTTGGQ